MTDRPASASSSSGNHPLPIVVVISGRGSNLQSLIDAIDAGHLNATIRCVISNQPDAAGLARAARARLATAVVNHRDFSSRAAFDAALADAIDQHSPGLVVLAGFMRILGEDFVRRFHGRLINIHPSLLPDFPGLDTHQRAIEAGVREHGASVHFVTGELDGGPIIAQTRVPVLPDDDADRLAARVLKQEHRLLPEVVALFANGRVELRDGEVHRRD